MKNKSSNNVNKGERYYNTSENNIRLGRETLSSSEKQEDRRELQRSEGYETELSERKPSYNAKLLQHGYKIFVKAEFL